MARLNIDTGTLGNPATGDTLRTAMTKINTNFEELYLGLQQSDDQGGLITTNVTNGDLRIQPNGVGIIELDKLKITDDDITSLVTNGNVAITGNGTGGVTIEGITFKGTELSSDDSTQVTIKENLNVTGTITGDGSGLTNVGGGAISSIDADSTTVSNLEVDNFKASAIVLESEGISSNDNDTTLPTSAAVKDYVDAQNTAQAITFVGDDSTGTAVNTGESFKIAGTQNITTAVSGDTLTITGPDISSFITAVSGATLTNKTFDANGNGNSISNLEVEDFAAASIVTEVEGIGANDNDTTIPTSAAVKNYVDTFEIGTGDLTITGSTISAPSNADLTLTTAGTGSVSVDGIQISGTELSSTDSTQITIKENLHVTGNISGTITGTVSTLDADNTTVSNLEVDNFKAATIVTEAEGIGSNDNDTTIPTSAAVKDYVDNNAGGSTGDLAITGSTISAPSNADLTLTTSGTGSVSVDGIQIKGTEISSADSTQVTIKENLHVTGTISGTVDASGLSGALPAISGSNLTGVAKFAFRTVQIGGGNTLVADDPVDTLTIHPGNNVTITDDDSLDSFTINVNGMGDLTFVGSTILSPSNADITLSPGGTGAVAMPGVTITDNTITSNRSNDNLELNANGTGTVVLENLKIGTSGSTVTTILDEDNMATNSATALATQQSIKAYVDSEISGVSGASTGDITFTGSTIQSPSNADITLDPSGTGGVVAQGPVTFNAGYIEKINALTSSSTITVDCALASIHTVTLGTSTEFNITNLPTGGTVTLIITQDGTGGRTATFGTDGSSAVKFPSNSSTLSTGAADIDVVTIINDGTNFLGNIAKDYRSS